MALKRILPLLVILLVLAGIVVLRQPQSEGQVARTALIMGTVVDVRAYGEDEKRLEKAVDAAFEEMARLEQLLSSHIASSEVSQLSQAQEGLKLSPETLRLIEMGQEIARRSGGAFDMTLGRLKQLWDVESENPRIPADEAIAAVLQGTGLTALKVEGDRVVKARPDLAVDLGGIAKGYAVDRAVEVLAEYGVVSATVNAGGDIRLLGDKNGKPWRIGIQHPRRSDDLLVTLLLQDRAVVTSGDYERFFERDGVRYHHILDPVSGRPARLCRSVTVVAADAARADALATAAFVMGPESGMKLLEELPNVEGLIVDSEGRLFKTAGLPE